MNSTRFVSRFLRLLCVVLTVAGTARVACAEDAPAYPIDSLLVLPIDGSINPATYNFLAFGYEEAAKRGHEAVLITLDTPGGLVSTTKDILTLIGDAPIPTIVWVTPEGASATSAGAFIAAGAHVLVMSAGTNIGAATPVSIMPQGGGLTPGGKSEDPNADALRTKATNDLVALVKSLSAARGRSSDLFDAMIREGASYSSKEALDEGVIDGIVANRDELRLRLTGFVTSVRGARLSLSPAATLTYDELEMDLGQRLLNVFADPSLAYMLLLLGAALLYLEFQAPGGFIAGLLGLVSLIMAGIGLQVLPLNFGALGLMGVAFALFILEAYVTSYGLLSLAGLASLLAGSLFLFRTDDAYLSVSWALIFGAVAAVGVFMLFLAVFLVRDLRKNKSPQDYYSLVGKSGKIVAVLGAVREAASGSPQTYQVSVDGELWKARGPAGLEKGEACVIRKQRLGGMVLQVERSQQS